MFIFFTTIFTASLINAFIHGWELTLVILAAMPVLILGKLDQLFLAEFLIQIQVLSNRYPVILSGWIRLGADPCHTRRQARPHP